MLENKEGQKVPEVTFHTQAGGQWKDITTKDLFAGKKVIVFSLPGAFTPTCSATHLPRYNDLAPVFKQHGIDDIICMSVNDTFVMNEWAKDQEAENVTLIPDGNGEFSKGMGLLVDKSNLGFGPRSWRYSMVVNDGTVEKMFIEPEKDGDPFEVSDAETMLEYLAPNAEKPKSVFLFAKEDCPYCANAKLLLKEKGLQYEALIVGKDVTSKTLQTITGRSTVPQVYIDGQHIGGSEDLERYFQS